MIWNTWNGDQCDGSCHHHLYHDLHSKTISHISQCSLWSSDSQSARSVSLQHQADQTIIWKIRNLSESETRYVASRRQIHRKDKHHATSQNYTDLHTQAQIRVQYHTWYTKWWVRAEDAVVVRQSSTVDSYRRQDRHRNSDEHTSWFGTSGDVDVVMARPRTSGRDDVVRVSGAHDERADEHGEGFSQTHGRSPARWGLRRWIWDGWVIYPDTWSFSRTYTCIIHNGYYIYTRPSYINISLRPWRDVFERT